MASARRPAGGTDPDGVRVTTTRRSSPIIPALLVLALAAWLVGRTWTEDPPRPAAAPVASEGAASPPADAKSPSHTLPPGTAPRQASVPASVAPAAVPRAERAERAEAARQARQQPAAESDVHGEPAFTANAPGETAGIAAFPPPGTKPIKHGIIVPDDFELPPGYVRHYQATDDGRRLVPILMFHPDFAPVDAGGHPIALPEDRIVPPELAPPGLPIRTLDETTDVDTRVGRKDHTTTQP